MTQDAYMRDESRTKRTDGELLRAFRTMGDEQAFADLMRRHGQMVHNTARALVGNAMEAEDIAQSTFLALARKGKMLEGADSVSGWLYHVTLCLARNAYRGLIRRKAREVEAAMLATEPDPGLFTEGVMVTLYEELGKLAEKYRQPVILHHLEGLDYETAAPMCGCNEQAFSMRLTRGREKLRERLAKRGVALGITALIAGLSQSTASAAELPAALVASTCQAATAVAAGGSAAGGGLVSAKVAALTDSALKLLFWGQVKTVAAVCASIAVLGGAGVTVATVLTHPPQPEARQAAVVAPVGVPVLPKVPNAAAASEYEDGAILFQDSFENGFANWAMYTRNGPEDEGSEVTNSPNIRIVHIERDGKTFATVEFDKQGSGWPRDGIHSKHITVPAVSAYSITYEYSFTDRPRYAMEGIETHMSGPPSATLLATGSWNRVRWECVPETTNSVGEDGTVSLFVNGEPFGKAEPIAVSASIGLVLEVIEGSFRFSNVVIREMQKKPQSQGLDAKERDIRIRQDTTVVKTGRKQS